MTTQDRAIRLDFTSDGSYAIELTPAKSDAELPLPMLAGPAVFHDDQGNVWVPERFSQGGRRTFHPNNLPKVDHIPVVADKEYKVSLYFSEGGLIKATADREALEAESSMFTPTGLLC